MRYFLIFISQQLLYIQLQTTSGIGYKLKLQIEFLDATNKTTFVIFDRDAEKILNKSAKDLAKKQTELQLI